MGRPSTTNYVPVPEHLPGKFCLFVYDRELERYSIRVHDGPQMTAYHLGEDSHDVRMKMRAMLPAFPNAMEQGLDAAFNFGVGQVMFATGRVIPVRREIEVETVLDHGFDMNRIPLERIPKAKKKRAS